MMKKTIKKLLAALLAVAMVCAMAIPAFAFESWETKEDLNKNHDYIAFQIFKGVISRVRTIRCFPALRGAATSLILMIF